MVWSKVREYAERLVSVPGFRHRLPFAQRRRTRQAARANGRPTASSSGGLSPCQPAQTDKEAARPLPGEDMAPFCSEWCKLLERRTQHTFGRITPPASQPRASSAQPIGAAESLFAAEPVALQKP